MIKILHKIATLANIMALYRTWHLVILDRFNCLNGIITHTLRDGTRYLTKAKKDDTGKINSIYIEKEYSECLKYVRDRGVVIDIGAHIGVFSVFIERSAKGVTVYSYEPCRENFDLLEKNVRLNGLCDSIRVFNAGLSGTGGRRELFLDPVNDGAHSIIERKDLSVIIDTVSLKDIFDENGIERCDFLKMDCEGAEYETLYNTPGEYLDRIGAISMEYHDNGDIGDLIKFLERNGFIIGPRRAETALLHAHKDMPPRRS